MASFKRTGSRKGQNIFSFEAITSSASRLGIPQAWRNSPLRSSLRKHVNRAKSPAGSRKTVSFCSQNFDKKISNVADCIARMQSGTELIKLRWTPTNKKPHKARIALSDIKEIRIGWNTDLLRATEGVDEIQEECAFSIIHGENYECLDLIALTPADANIWVTGLMAISLPNSEILSHLVPTSSGLIAANIASLRERWLANLFNEADYDQIGYITEKAALKLIRSINPKLISNKIKHKIKEASLASASSEQSKGSLDVNQFVEIYKDIATRPEIYFLMVRYANKDYLNCQDLQLFLETEQGFLEATTDLCQNIIHQYEENKVAKEHNLMTVDGFTNYLMSSGNSVFDPAQLVVCQDMTQPFNHYFVATSYNTYLVEDMRGQSSIDGYLSALKRNCRFIEVDIWEPDPMIDGLTREPVVCSGIRTNPGVPLSLVLDTISETAFEKTRYPLFIRIEVHLSIDQQRLVCELLEQHLGQKLYRPKEDPVNWALPENVPSPKKFMNRIILSGVHSEQICPSSKDGPQTFEAIEEDEGFEFSPGRCQCSEYKIFGALQDLIAPFAQSKILQDFASIIIGENDKLNELCPRKHIVSMNEGTCLRMLMLNEQNELVTTSHNNHSFARRYHEFLLRVTPNSSRIDSSNLNPQEFWNFGISLVALNYQTPGLMMDLLEGKFLANGGCGYVLKPPLMRKHGTFSPIDKMEGFAQVLHIKIHSAQQLPRPRASTAKGDSADPYIVLEVFGVPADCAEERTRTVRNDSFNPTFDESFQFEITVPEVALIRFLVLDDEFIDDDFIGQYTIPFECLQSGYRHIPLLNNEGDPLEHCTIFVHIAVTNRRGGGKPKKRGLSVRRMMNRVQTGMKAIGIKSVDDQFSKAMSHLSRFIEMKNQLESLLTEWQKESGLAPTSTIRQGLRLMHSRIVAASNSVGTQLGEDNTEFSAEQCVPSFSIIGCDEYHARVKSQGQIPETIEKSFTLLDDLLKCCSTIVDSTDELLSSVSEITRKIIEGCEDFAKFCTEAGLRGQKATRANENFNWNIKMCRTQIMLMTTTLAEAKAMLQQAFETAKMLEILEEENPNKNQSCD